MKMVWRTIHVYAEDSFLGNDAIDILSLFIKQYLHPRFKLVFLLLNYCLLTGLCHEYKRHIVGL